MSKIINIVATQCNPEVEQKFNKWYNEVHIPMLMKSKQMKGVKRIKVLQPGANIPTYLALYEFDSLAELEAYRKGPELAAARDEMKVTWKDGGYQSVWSAPYEVLGEWNK